MRAKSSESDARIVHDRRRDQRQMREYWMLDPRRRRIAQIALVVVSFFVLGWVILTMLSLAERM